VDERDHLEDICVEGRTIMELLFMGGHGLD